MQTNKKINIAVISIDNLSDIFMTLGEEGKKAAIARVEKSISEIFEEVCSVYHIKDNVFICKSTINIRGYISQFKDTIGFSEIKEKFPLKVTVKYQSDIV